MLIAVVGDTSEVHLLKLWTIQAPEAWELAQQRGVLRADGRRVDPWFRYPYRWLREQMRQRVPGATGCYPVWAWHTPKPDLRSSQYRQRGFRCVRIEFEAPPESVLLSDLEAWHAVLNGWYLPISEGDRCEFYLRAARWGMPWPRVQDCLEIVYGTNPGDALDPVRMELGLTRAAIWHEIRSSWERVFDLEALANSDYWYDIGDPQIQETIEQVTLDQVVTVDHFVAR